jgi:dienelactone hydrolase
MQAKHFRNHILIIMTMLTLISYGYSKSPSPSVKEEMVSYKAGDITLKGFVAFDESIKGKRPVVLVVHEWWGLNDYTKMRARKLAALGYIAMAVDLFGDGKNAADPKEAQALTMPFYQDPQLAKTRLDAAVKKIKEFAQADPNNVAVIGYCFGGFAVLNFAKQGADLKGVVSFHGGLGGVPANKKLLKAKILVCQGASDKFVSLADVDAFKHQMDSIGADYTVKIYANATHAFTNPASTANGKKFNLPIEYNAQADADSWNDMKTFLLRIFAKNN